MRRRKPVTRKVTRRPIRRRMSGVGASSPVMQVAGLIGGAILARVASNVITKAKPDLNSKIINAAQIGLGLYMPKLIKSQLGKDLGNGMIAAGGLGLVTSLGVINGIDVISGMEDQEFIEMTVNGIEDNTEIDFEDSLNGIDVVSGIDDDNFDENDYNY